VEEKTLIREVINIQKITDLSNRIKTNYPKFKQEEFLENISKHITSLKVLDRISLVSSNLYKFLPKDYPKALSILLQSQLEPLKEDESENYGDFIGACLNDYVANYGCSKEYLDLSLNAIYSLTQRFSCEFAIRVFLEQFEQETLKKLKQWTKDSHCHVRRLCSEGIRPKLPWAKPLQKYIKNPETPLSLLSSLYSDSSRYVTRSVANCLNDISKNHPEIVIETLKTWEKEGKQNKKEFEWIKNHALRTLIKSGNSLALEYLGFSQNLPISSSLSILTPIVHVGENLEFTLSITALEKTKLLIDYKIYFVKANKKLSSKVFKLKTIDLEKGKSCEIIKKHGFKIMSTRTLYSGDHYIEIQINGKGVCKKKFKVKK
jgi:3-methyladenine DNA glycosylase AlkC